MQAPQHKAALLVLLGNIVDLGQRQYLVVRGLCVPLGRSVVQESPRLLPAPRGRIGQLQVPSLWEIAQSAQLVFTAKLWGR